MSRYRERVIINGNLQWISGYSRQDLFDRYVYELERCGLIERVDGKKSAPFFRDYANEFYETFRQDQQSNTVVNRDRILRNHILPRLGDCKIDQITTTDIQKWFNELAKKYAKETILKIKNIINPVFDAAVEDHIIDHNPLRSTRLEIGGKDTVSHKALPNEKMEEIKQSLPSLDGKEQIMAGLLCYTGMRFEEVLGLQWEDIDGEWITIRRAVVHPKRNAPEIKSTKTKTSERIIPYCNDLKNLLENKKSTGFLLASSKDPTGQTPLSYSEARRVFEKIRKQFGIKEYTAHDFRDTCATVWRENGMPLDVIARLLGHAKTETTERKYVKYRPDLLSAVASM